MILQKDHGSSCEKVGKKKIWNVISPMVQEAIFYDDDYLKCFFCGFLPELLVCTKSNSNQWVLPSTSVPVSALTLLAGPRLVLAQGDLGWAPWLGLDPLWECRVREQPEELAPQPQPVPGTCNMVRLAHAHWGQPGERGFMWSAFPHWLTQQPTFNPKLHVIYIWSLGYKLYILLGMHVCGGMEFWLLLAVLHSHVVMIHASMYQYVYWY